jgi:hypothetical protein
LSSQARNLSVVLQKGCDFDLPGKILHQTRQEIAALSAASEQLLNKLKLVTGLSALWDKSLRHLIGGRGFVMSPLVSNIKS